MESSHSSQHVPRESSDVEPTEPSDAHAPARADAAPARDDALVVRGSPDPAPVARSGDRPQREAAGPDETSISSEPPLPLKPLADELHPHDLGRALEGQQIDDVLLEQFIGGGGMGAVFRALDTKLHRTVAVKVLSTYQTGDAGGEHRFEMEARSAARLDHPNIARVYYAGEGRGVRYIVFEYIDGTNVRDLVRSYGPLPLADALRYTLQIADALVHAWQREVVHRDIKPSNILITPDAQAKLVDMGLARYEQVDAVDQEQTATGVTLGTFDYISPEQARNPRDADTRSDIYSLGCTLFFMLTGRPPFPDGTAMQKVLRHQADPPPDLRTLRPDVQEPVVQIVETMLAKKAEDRFQNPAQLATVLASCIDQLGIGYTPLAMSAGRHGDSPVASWPPWSLPWRSHALWVVPCVLLLVGVAILELLLPRDVSPPQFPELRIPAVAEPSQSDQPAPAGEVTSPPQERAEFSSQGSAPEIQPATSPSGLRPLTPDP